MKRPVVFVVESGGLSGGVRVILEEAVRLQRRGWEVSIYSVDRQPAWFLLPQGMWRQFQDYHALQVALVAEDSFKIATWWKTAAVLMEALRGDEGVYLVQDIETSYYSQPFMKKAVMETYDYPLRRYTTSRWVEENLPDTTYVGIGIDLELYRPLDIRRKSKAIMAISRLQALKGFRQLSELSRRLGKDYELYTLGVHPTKLIGAWKQHYVGLPDSQVVRMYNEMFCFVSTTQHEGFGLPHIEAMACGLPVVTTDADGNRYFCESGQNCLMVERNDMRAMALAVKAMTEDDPATYELRETCIAGGLETAQEYRWEPVIDRLEKFLLT